MPRTARDRLTRVKLQPLPEQWAADESMTLFEAVAVFFPHGPLTLSSLRTEAKAGRLAVCRVAGKDLTTPGAIKELVTPCRAENPSHPASISEPNATERRSGSSSTVAGKSAQAAARRTLQELRQRSRTTSPTSTNQPSAPVIPLPLRPQTS